MPEAGTVLDRLNGRAALWLARAGAACLFALMMLTFADVVGRSIRYPILGGTELTTMLMGLIVFFSLGHTTVTRGHLRADFVFSRFSPRTKLILDIFTHSIAAVVVGLICWRLFAIASSRFVSGEYTLSLRMPLWLDAYLIAVASLLLLSSTVLQAAGAVRSLATRSAHADNPPRVGLNG